MSAGLFKQNEHDIILIYKYFLFPIPPFQHGLEREIS